jgi:hypothetical protein
MKNEIVRITEENPSYTSMVMASVEDKKRFYNAVENPTKKLSDFINKKIVIKDVSMEFTEIQERDDEGNPIPGAVKPAVKTVIVTPDGTGVFSTSMGLARAMYSLFNIFGTPDTWEEPLCCIVKQVEIGKNRTFKLEVV